MIPDWLRDNLAAPPQAGAGIHAWLFSVARQLHAHMPPAAVEAALMASTAGAARRVTAREIRDAVANSREIAWQRTPAKAGQVRGGTVPKAEGRRVAAPAAPAAPDLARWPAGNPVARRCRIADAAGDGVGSVADLWARSPVICEGVQSCDDWLDWLFPGAEWLCLATDHPGTARSRPPHKWSFGPADGCGLVVPSPMTGPSGRNLMGEASHRCLENTAPRRWLVIEFDSGALDEQAALHWHLAGEAAAAGWPRLALVVASGGKSMHGWYGLCGDEETSKNLMAYARTLGADPATFNRCQLVRLPEGLRRKATAAHYLPDEWDAGPAEVRQPVWYWDPSAARRHDTILCSTLGNMNSTALPGRRGLTPALAGETKG